LFSKKHLYNFISVNFKSLKNMKFFYIKGVIALALLIGNNLNAQNNEKLKSIANEYSYNNNDQINFVKLKEDYVITESSVEAFLNSVVLNNSEVTAKKTKSEPDHLGYLHTKYQLFYKNTAINNSVIIVHSINGKVISINGDLNAIQKPVNKITLNESTALQFALKKVNAKRYKWENKTEEQHMKKALNQPNFSYFPKGDLVIYTKQNVTQKPTIHYAYKFTIYAEEPLYKANVIVDAQTGIVLEEQNLICTVDVPATAVTKYSGTKPMTVDNNAPSSYRLREVARGLGVETYNMQNTVTYSATDFTNSTTSWNAINVDQAARDAHWGAENTYDYYLNAHNRNSIDNAGYKLLSYVHYSTNYNNAFWDGTRMTYGDGNGTTFTILTAIDVCGHEITHGLVSNTANLGTGEAGALNEAFADIFGTTIENFARPTQWDWKIGADITPSGNGIRNMSNPNLLGQPDTYLGTNWDPAGEVHKNDGPCIFWYYLLCQGGSGTNDNSNVYNVSGLGMTSAALIAYRALTVYFTPTTTYLTARNYAIQAAKDLYGSCSNEVVQTTNAWYAVGVGPAYVNTVTSNFIANSTTHCNLPASVIFNNTTTNGNTYNWDFGDGGVSTSTNPVHTYTAAGTYTVKLKSNGCLTAVDSITKPSYIVVSIPNNPTTTGAAICGTGTVSLSASGTSQLYWYATPTATGSPLTIGNNYVTPSLIGNTTYYVVNTSTNAPVFGAPTGTSIGTSANYNTAGQYDIFDVNQGCTLRSVVVYASVAGNRTIELRNSSNVLITSTVVNIPAGMSTVNLNFALTPGTGYQLGLSATSAINLYRNSTGAVFPYNISGLVSVTNSSAGAPYFYFFYNWQVQKNSCTSSAIAVTATVNTPPVLTVNTPTICLGQNINLNASGAGTYTWSTGSNAQSINIAPIATTVYTVSASNGIGCNSSLSATVTVNPNPTISISSATICSGQTANISATGANTYTWSTGANASSINVTPANTTQYTVTASNSFGCNASASTTVSVNPTPIVTVNSATICNGQTANLNVNGATSYSWSSGQNTGNISVNPNTTTSYTAYGTSGNCSAASIANVIVNPIPVVAVSATQTMVCLNDGLVTLTGSPNGGIYSGQGVTGSNFDPATGVGNYYSTYSYTDANGCSSADSVNIVVSICTDIKSANSSSSFLLYPNPAKDYFIVSSTKVIALHVIVTDAIGKLILEKDLSLSAEKIDISKYAKGIYFIELKDASKTVYRAKIVKE
jgi:Zn-dependent metalloprotease